MAGAGSPLSCCGIGRPGLGRAAAAAIPARRTPPRRLRPHRSRRPPPRRPRRPRPRPSTTRRYARSREHRRATATCPSAPPLPSRSRTCPPARPQWGLDKADIVFEEPVEGGITRFIAVYQCHNAVSHRAGAFRSLRRRRHPGAAGPDPLRLLGRHPAGDRRGRLARLAAPGRGGRQGRQGLSSRPDARTRRTTWRPRRRRCTPPPRPLGYPHKPPPPLSSPTAGCRPGAKPSEPSTSTSLSTSRPGPGTPRTGAGCGLTPTPARPSSGTGRQRAVSAANVVVMHVARVPHALRRGRHRRPRERVGPDRHGARPGSCATAWN